jgi:TolB-like protein/DNA-binding winged helix-turn-helix (wHTH) protein/cytochrome c-type biogenesis protein CcmH/NrfG
LPNEIKSRERIFFGEFELDCRSGELRCNGTPVKLQPQPAKVLAALASRPGEIVTRQQIVEEVWGSKVHVDFEHGLNFAIRQIRAVLKDDPDHPRYLETVPKRGYRFIGVLHESPAIEPAPLASAVITSSRTKAFAYSAVLVMVMVIAVLTAISKQWFTAGSKHEIQSIAVLPLHNLSADPQQEYFSDGMTDELITDLAKISGLRVISHTSVEHYKETKRQLPEIARELGVDAIVEGTILRSGDRVRITAQLIDSHSDQHVWAESYERDFGDVLGLQAEVAQQIANQIGIKLTAGEQRRLAIKHLVDPAAQEDYLKGMFYWNRLTCSDFETALKYFQEAAAKDPNFASSYSGMADAYFDLADWRCWPQSTFAKAEVAALKAVELDPASGEGHSSIGELAFSHDWDWAKAGREFSTALQLDPNNSGIRCAYAIYLVSIGRPEPALAEMQKAQQLDPVSEDTRVSHIYVMYLAHKYDDAIVQAKQALDLFPESRAIYYWLGHIYEKKGMPDEAIAAYLKALDHLPEEVSRRRTAYDKQGLPGYWREDREFRQRSHRENDPVLEAMYFAHMGDKEQALNQLNLAYQQHCDGLQFLKVHPVYDILHADPRFTALIAQLRL